MKNALIALFAVVGFGSGVALADELKAPNCDSKMRGVMWNFGSEDSPDIRRCDGISYIPYGHATSSAAPKSSESAGACSNTCAVERHACENQCSPSFMDPDCRQRCQRAQTRCETKC